MVGDITRESVFEKSAMEPKMTRREMMEAGVLLAGCVVVAAGRGAIRPPRASTCCSTPDVEPESVTFGPGGLTIDLLKAPSLRRRWAVPPMWSTRTGPWSSSSCTPRRSDTAFCPACARMAGQVVSYNRARGMLQCNNFNHSIFELNGSVWKGPGRETAEILRRRAGRRCSRDFRVRGYDMSRSVLALCLSGGGQPLARVCFASRLFFGLV